MKRLLDCTASDFLTMGSRELLAAIAASEGRVLVSETIGALQPVLGNITNAEFVAAMGADIILCNMFDVQKPVILGLPDTAPEETIRTLKRLTGRPVGINLEPLEEGVESSVETQDMWRLTGGRAATLENARKAVAMGVDMIVLTGNPGIGVTNEAIIQTLTVYKEAFGDEVILTAGKMHAAGILSEGGEHIITEEEVQAFVRAGADIILMPAPGTVPGITMEYIRSLVSCVHKLGALALTAIGTSQEGADTATIREIALMCKMAGADLHHLGDAGFCGMAVPENITEYSKAIRGVRHTYHRMAASICR